MRQSTLKLLVRLQSDSGANLIEYGFLAVLIAVAALLSVQFVGGATSSNIDSINPAFSP
ncbi:MAG: Flp family type IVb pilin [Acidimicrobiia bacterium]|nr:Flp family type IVb pilin [Acidimicrobiia bacterium]